MTIFSAVSQETNLGGVLTTSLSTSGSSFSARMYDTKTGLSRTPQSTTLDFIISHGTTKAERIRCSSHSTASGITTFTIASSGRALPMYGTGAGSSSGNAHYIGATIGCVTNHEATEELNKVVDGTNGTGANNFRVGAETAADVSFYAQNDQATKPRVYFDESAKTWKISRGDDNGAAGDFAIHQLPQLTTAERDALPEIVNGYAIYNTTLGTAQYYKAGAWVSFDVGTPPGNAADHTAGLLDVASATEMQAGTATDATSGALNAVVVGNTTETSAGAGDYGKVPRLGSGGRLDDTVHNQTLVGGLTTNADTLHTHAQFPEEYTMGENIDGSTTPQAALIASGSFSLTAGRVYKSSSILIGRGDFAGFVKDNLTSGNTGKLYNGIVSGFTGLTQGAYYYVTNTSGSIQAGFYPFTQNKNKVCVGQAVSSTEIDTRKVPLPRFNIGMPEAIQVTLSDLAQSVSGSGATSVRETGILLTSGATNNSDAIRYSATTLNMSSGRYDFGYDHVVSFSFRCSASTDQDIFMGLHANQETTINADATDTDDHMGIYIQDGTLYVSNAGAATQTRTSVAATLTNVNLIRIETDRVTGSIAFYLNDSLAAYHTTNTPSAGTMYFVFGITNRAAADKQLALFAPVHWGHSHY